MAGWGATIEGGQINGTLLSAKVCSFNLFRCATKMLCLLSVTFFTSTWKVPLVDQEDCKTIYGESLQEVNASGHWPSWPFLCGQIFKNNFHHFVVTWLHNILRMLLNQFISGDDVRGRGSCRRLSGEVFKLYFLTSQVPCNQSWNTKKMFSCDRVMLVGHFSVEVSYVVLSPGGSAVHIR